jgi:intein-encoded DNA endonuclease-like protein
MRKHLHAANHNQPLLGGLIMTDPNIAISKHLLKRLEEEINFLNSLMAQVLAVTSNLKGTWTSIKHAQESWKRDIEKH